MANPAPKNSPLARSSRVVGFATRLAAQLSILTTLGGIPYALYTLAGNPLPDQQLPTWSQLGELLTARDDGSLFMAAVTWVGWIGWASFALPLLVEITCHVFRWRPPRILGLAWQQRRAAALVAAALSVGAAPAVASANAVTMPAAPSGIAAVHASTPAPTTHLASLNTTLPLTLSSEKTAATKAPVYEVARGDWLYHIAERFLSDGDRYVDIAKLNPALEEADPRFPDHIVAGQVLNLPADADDRGARHHATGKLRTPTKPPTTQDSTRATPQHAPAQVTPVEPTPATATPAPSTGATTSPTTEASAPSSPTPVESSTPAPAHTPGGEDHEPVVKPDDGDLDAALPITAALATAGLLAALLLLRLAQRRRRQRQHRRPGRRIPTPNPSIERRVRAAAQPVDVNRLDHALRALAAGLRDHDPDDVPDLAAAWLSAGEVHLMLAQANAGAPPPFQADSTAMDWMLPAHATLPDVDDTLAPLPVLATVASRPGGDHLLIDLERTGLLTVRGDATRTADLIRYIAAEVATNQWSDDAEVVLAGFDPVDADNLITIGGNRVTAAISTTNAIERARRRAAANAKAMTDTGITSTFAGRVRDVVADAWMPHVLLIADATDAEEHLTALADELRLAGRCAVAVVAVTGTATTWHVDVNEDGGLAVDWLNISNTAATRLPREQLARLAPVMRAARAAAPTEEQPGDEPVPVATDADSWADGADAHGHLLNADSTPDHAQGGNPEDTDHAVHDDRANAHRATDQHAQERRPAVPEPRSTPAPTQPGTTVVQPVDIAALTPIANGATARTAPAASSRPREPHDPTLDEDLDAWYRPDPHRPRIAILGPVEVHAPGEMPDERIRFYGELVVYLMQRGRAGATGEQIDEALWPDRGVNARSRRVAISKARRWLGESAEGIHWLPPNAGADRLYRLTPGVLLDWQLFRRLRARGEARGVAGTVDLRRALELVRGEPLAGAELPYSSGYRNPYTWLPGSDVQPHNLASAVVDTAHQLVDLYLAAGDTSGARWAVDRAWLADPARLDDHPWVDAMRVARADGRSAELRALLDDLVRTREAEVPEDLSPDTYGAIHELVGDLLRVG
ncbi:peptidoglycan-binding protein [Plantactinospora sp. CA-290183]|uniref:peptidoglycan-binding protein n=1 Tax=Plantactinospora sp. CA-290183 TaxID=3240006 RepID=UPI003D8AA127